MERSFFRVLTFLREAARLEKVDVEDRDPALAARRDILVRQVLARVAHYASKDHGFTALTTACLGGYRK